MKFDFVPKVCQGENPSYSGHIVVEVPKAPDRYRIIRESGVISVYEKAKDGGKDEQSFDLASQYELVTKMAAYVEAQVKEVHLKRLSDGLEVKTVDELLSISSLESAVMEICLMFLKGFEPGKNSGT